MRLVTPTRVARGLSVLVVAAGVAVLSPASYADPGGDVPTDPGAGVTDAVADPLAVAQDLVDGTAEPGTDPTLVLNQLSQDLPDLSPTEQRQAQRILARPTDGGDPADVLLTYETAEETPYCTGHVCVHYVATGADAPPGATVGGAPPRRVTLTASFVNHAWATEVGSLGYRAPLADRGPGSNEGPDSRLDVYLGDIGSDNPPLFGYVASDRPAPDRSSAFMVLDDDFSKDQFPGPTSSDGMHEVTVAHEFFHTIQYAYDQYDDVWFMEATATWMEEQVYDGVNDNRGYLPFSTLKRPALPLDGPNTVYGNWSFFQFLSERLGRDAVRGMWNRAAQNGVYSTLAVRRVLLARDTSLAKRFPSYLASGLVPARSFQEGARFPRTAVSQTWHLGPQQRSTGKRSVRINHLAGRHYAFVPGSRTSKAWKLRVRVDGPGARTGAVVIVDRKDGTLVRRPVPVAADGSGTVWVTFDRGAVRRVTVTLANTSAQYRCNTGDVYSCNGTSRDDGRTYTFSALASR